MLRSEKTRQKQTVSVPEVLTGGAVLLVLISLFPQLESLQTLLGADPGRRLRLQAGCHPIPDGTGVEGDRQ